MKKEDQKKIRELESKIQATKKNAEELKKVLTDQNEVIEGSKKFEETTKFVIGGLKEQVKNLDKERKRL